MNKYNVKETKAGLKVTKIAPYDMASYYWAEYDPESGETLVYKNNVLEDIQWFDEVADVIDHLKMANSTIKPMMCHN